LFNDLSVFDATFLSMGKILARQLFRLIHILFISLYAK